MIGRRSKTSLSAHHPLQASLKAQDWSARPVLASPVQYQPTSQLQQGQNSPKLWPIAHRPFSDSSQPGRPFLLLAATHQQLDAHHHPRDHTSIICCSHLTLLGSPSEYCTILFLVSPLTSLSGSLRNILPATTRGTTLFTRCCARSTARRSLPAPAARNATHKPPPSRPRACTRLATSRHTHSLHSSTHHLPLPLSPSPTSLTHSLRCIHTLRRLAHAFVSDLPPFRQTRLLDFLLCNDSTSSPNHHSLRSRISSSSTDFGLATLHFATNKSNLSGLQLCASASFSDLFTFRARNSSDPSLRLATR